ncbi:CYTH domain-containing protein [Candidatus Babeliales bacterium]|nr:CYTH domain-containing protein [Candidatus Babeliales bacterium]
MNHFEIELRYELRTPQQLASFLSSCEKLHKKHDTDIYLDNPQALLYQRGIFVRIRNNKKLDIKFNRATLENPDLAIQDYCEEHSFALPLQVQDLERLNPLLVSLDLKPLIIADLDHLKYVNNFVEHYVVDKRRTTYKRDAFTICVDEVAGLGTFLEIELMASCVEDLERVKQSMQLLVKELDVVPLKTGYCTLLLRKKHFKQYLLGRFILDEDKVHRDAVGAGREILAR